MAKLTNAQLSVLSNAARREDGTASVPERLNRAAAAKIAASLVARGLMREIRAKAGMPAWRTDDGRRVGLIITRAGRDAVGGEDKPGKIQGPSEAKSLKPVTKSEEPAIVDLPRAGSKQALLVAMLTKDNGASLSSLNEATGWLPHTTRAALTGLRKRGFAVERTRDERLGPLYRIVGAQAAPVAA